MSNHLIVEALAGTGKTFTLIEGLKRMKGKKTRGIVGSAQQELIWKEMRKGDAPKTIQFVAFNKSIADELSSKVPAGVNACTMHSLGYKAIRDSFGRSKVSNWKTVNIVEEIEGTSWREITKDQSGRDFLDAVKQLTNLCKQSLTCRELITLTELTDEQREQWNEELQMLADHYDVTLNGQQDRIFEIVPEVLRQSAEMTHVIDFSDMIWLPLVLNLGIKRNDLLLVDEAPDLNRCQQQLALLAGDRLILVGDRNQSIYGFAGADTSSIPRMIETLEQTERGLTIVPLTVTRRCSKAVTRRAAQIVPDFECLEDAVEGLDDTVEENQFDELVVDGDMVLCRTNAPLVRQVFKFLSAGRKAAIKGRDIGKGLVTFIQKFKVEDVSDLMNKIEDWELEEMSKIAKLKRPSETRRIAITDKAKCVMMFCENCTTIDGVIAAINRIFDDETQQGIQLSSIHRAKGLESRNVFILHPELLPHPMAKSAWAMEQERNLEYVADTRSMENLYRVNMTGTK